MIRKKIKKVTNNNIKFKNMKKIIILIILFNLPIKILFAPESYEKEKILVFEKLYENVWGTFYYAEKKQCDNTPLITGSGYHIDTTLLLKKDRIIAISQNMLHDLNRFNMLKNKHEDRFRGKIKYGDVIWIESPKDKNGNYIYPNVVGLWRVEDTKNKRYKNSVDFLIPKGDMSLFNNNPSFKGIFENLQIYKIKKMKKMSIKTEISFNNKQNFLSL